MESRELAVVRAVVCDEHALYRRALVTALDETEDIEVVAEADRGVEAVELASALAPDVVLIDLHLAGIGGVETARLIVESLPTARILMLSESESADDLFDAVKAGAIGYVLKARPLAEVLDAVRAASRGESVITPIMARKLMQEFSILARRDEETSVLRATTIGATEIGVLRCLADGATNRDIARELLLTENSVKNHVSNILAKLALNTRAEAVLYAVRERLVDP